MSIVQNFLCNNFRRVYRCKLNGIAVAGDRYSASVTIPKKFADEIAEEMEKVSGETSSEKIRLIELKQQLEDLQAEHSRTEEALRTKENDFKRKQKSLQRNVDQLKQELDCKQREKQTLQQDW